MTMQSHCVNTIKNYGNFKLTDSQSLCVEVKVRITYLIQNFLVYVGLSQGLY
jgi:hypothetical protein